MVGFWVLAIRGLPGHKAPLALKENKAQLDHKALLALRENKAPSGHKALLALKANKVHQVK